MDPTGLVFADRSDRAKLRVTDDQRAWYLHQVLTQEFEDIRPGEARDACMITVHGRMTAFVEAVATEDAILIHAEAGLRESLGDELQRYVFATRAAISDATDEIDLVLVAGTGLDDALSELGTPVVRHPTASLGVPAAYLWVRPPERDDVVRELEKAGAREAGEDDLEAVRIARGVPRWGFEMTPKTFPQEVGIDDRAVHYEKGCYLGQEAMAKIHFRGKVNRRKVRLRGERPLTRGAEVALEGTKVGAVTSAWKEHAIALVRHTVGAGARVAAGEVPAEVVD